MLLFQTLYVAFTDNLPDTHTRAQSKTNDAVKRSGKSSTRSSQRPERESSKESSGLPCAVTDNKVEAVKPADPHHFRWFPSVCPESARRPSMTVHIMARKLYSFLGL